MRLSTALCTALLVSFPGAGAAQDPCVRVVSITGTAPAGVAAGGCLSAGQEITTPAGSEVVLQTPGGGEITLRGNNRFKVEGLTPKGENFVLLRGRALFEVIAGRLDFFRVRGEGKGKEVFTRVWGTRYEMDVTADRILVDPEEGQIRVTRQVKLRIEETARPSGQAARDGREEDRYFEEPILLDADSEDFDYPLDEDEYLDIDTYEECVSHFTGQLEESQGRYGGEDDPDVSTAWVNLGDCHLAADEGSDAAFAFEAALEIDERLGDVEAVAEDLRGLGEAYLILGQWTDAIGAFERALSIDRELWGEDDYDVADDYYLLSDAYAARAESPDAESGDGELSDEYWDLAEAIEDRLEGN